MTPVENVLAMFDTVEEFGVYTCKRQLVACSQ